MQAVLEVVGWQMAKWHADHEVSPAVTPFDWIEVIQEAAADFPQAPTPLADTVERIAHLAAVALIVLGELPHPADVEDREEWSG